MLAKKRFLLGGGGAMMPVLVSILAVDVGAQLIAGQSYTMPEILGTAIRYAVLFLIGGLVAYLHVDEEKPFKLFELGIAAPALITSLVTANGIASTNVAQHEVVNPQTQFEITLFSAAYASENTVKDKSQTKQQSSPSKLKGFIDGLTGKVYQRKTSKSLPQAGSDADSKLSQSGVNTQDDQAPQSNQD